MKITVLTENTANKRGLLGEHGLSVLIEVRGKKLLFDTGQSSVYVRNAERLGMRLDDADAVVLSHGHYDHTG
ncbi:MAG: MBL fold metallo-hydrolase, partial [Eisenbergiella sp.]